MIHLKLDAVGRQDMTCCQAAAKAYWQKDGVSNPWGAQHYYLLRYLASVVKKDVLELGSGTRVSTACLADGCAEDGRRVVSTDIEYPREEHAADLPGNVSLFQEDCVSFVLSQELADFDLIFIDVDHEGVQEREVLDHLIRVGWKGCVLMDDVRACTHLRNIVLEEIDLGREVFDLTRWGHWSGSFLLNFGRHLTLHDDQIPVAPLKNIWM